MTIKIADLIIGFVFIGLLIGSATVQPPLKEEPQIIMLLFGGLTLASFFTKSRAISTVLFYLFIGILLFINYTVLTIIIITKINPVNSSPNVLYGFWSFLLALFLSPFTIIIYHRLQMRNRIIEIAGTAIFILITTIVYMKYELL